MGECNPTDIRSLRPRNQYRAPTPINRGWRGASSHDGFRKQTRQIAPRGGRPFGPSPYRSIHSGLYEKGKVWAWTPCFSPNENMFPLDGGPDFGLEDGQSHLHRCLNQ